MILRYLTLSEYPSILANRLQVIKSSSAFAQVSDFILYIVGAESSCRPIFSQYNIQFPFRIKYIGRSFLWPRSFWLAKKYLHVIKSSDVKTIWYVRDVLLAFWLTFLGARFRGGYFFELHSLTRFPKLIYRRVLLNSLGIITTNNQKKNDIVNMFNINRDFVLVAGNGIDINEFRLLPNREDARKSLGIVTSKPVVVYTGTLACSYGSAIIGYARYVLKDEIEFITVSGKSRNEALTYMMAADILVAPYLDENIHFRAYMSPMKLKEYMAACRPIITSDLPSIREILDDSMAFFTQPGDADAFVEKIRYVISNYDEAKKKAEIARAEAVKYEWSDRAGRIIDFMSKKLDEK